MDKIKKFIKQKPTKNKRIIEYNDKELEITKKDITKIKKFKQNKCLDPTLNLYRPNNTKWSSITQKEPLTHKRNTKLSKIQYNNFINKIKNIKETHYKDINEIEDIWNDDCILNQSYSIKFSKIHQEALNNGIAEYTLNDAKNFIKSIKNKYYVPIKKRKKIEDLLPKLPTKIDSGDFIEEIGLKYLHEEKIKNFTVCDDKFIVCFANKILLYEFSYKRLLNEFIVDKKIEKCILRNEIIILSYEDKIKAILLDAKQDEIKISNKNNDNKHIKYIKENDNIIVIDHNQNKIKDMDLYKHFIACIAGKTILIHDIQNYKSNQPIKLNTELPIKIKFMNNKFQLMVSTTNNFYVYDIMSKEFIAKFNGTFSFVHTFAFNNEIFILGDKNNRISIIHGNKVVKVMEQNEPIKDILCHSKRNQFIVKFEGYISIFYWNIENEFLCNIEKELKMKAKGILYHETMPWVYAVENKQLNLYT